MGKVKLFGTRISPFVLRIIWALKLKGIEYEFMHEDLNNKSPELLKYNPIYKKVPVLLHNGKPICESLVILEYIEEKWKDISPILPIDPLDRADARFWAKFCDEKVLPSFHAHYVKEGKDKEEAKETCLANLKIMEEFLDEKKFFGGENIGLLDLVFGWIAYYTRPSEVLADRPTLLDKDLCPKLSSWRERLLEIAVISES